MAQLKSIVEYCNDLLRISEFRDYCPNGLQVEGKPEIRKLVSGVTACQALIDQAVEQQADAILVHHGYFWKNEEAVITGIKRNRIQKLLQHDISLLAYHLPLDAHGEFGNNITLGKVLKLDVEGCVTQGVAKDMLWYGRLPKALSASELSEHIGLCLGRSPLHLAGQVDKPIRTLGWCTGGAQHYIEEAAKLGLDAYISGEVSEQTFHLARELGIHFYAAGHHATESYGVQALAAHLREKFTIETEFVNIVNPV